MKRALSGPFNAARRIGLRDCIHDSRLEHASETWRHIFCAIDGLVAQMLPLGAALPDSRVSASVFGGSGRGSRSVRRVRLVHESEDLEFRYSPDATPGFPPGSLEHETVPFQTLPRERGAGDTIFLRSVRQELDVWIRFSVSALGAEKDPGGEMIHRQT
ncbi:hypothetical protein I8D64_08115 [Brachybacterium sp. MASK1Z-5]|uniref:Uncharacterized protein n=1 Tax=Brachybacterium halotolerans TaxID=2795215 RepID=A0ABS1B9R6_9MICO|nr:hypothetical protein [Brachybacterium halotolerans]MBK0331365.1 hypothetical protein [Brachybacterium halotolerans]